MKKRVIGIVNEEYKEVGVNMENNIQLDKVLDSSKLMSLLEVSDSHEIEIIVPTVKVLSKTLNGITQALNKIHDKGFTFKAIEENVSTENEQAFDSYVKQANLFNEIALQQAYERELQIRIGGKKRGKRETFKFPQDWEEMYQKMIMGEMTKTELQKYYNVSRQSIYVWLDRYEKEKQIGKYKVKN